MNLDLKKYKSDLLFIPLGGSNEIGLNANLYHIDGKWLMVDLGIGFASTLPGIDMYVPDISFIKSQKKNLLGLVITHIHEDHLGAIQYLWEELQMPIYASPFTAKFLKDKLGEFSFADKVKIIEAKAGTEIKLDPFKVEFIHLTHSTPEMNAVLIKTTKGNVLHTGDWRFDENPVIGKASDKETIKKYGDKGEILALVCDSTNIGNTESTRSESELLPSLIDIISTRRGRVLVSTFGSNVSRMDTIMRAAKACGRKVVLAGHAIQRIDRVAKDAGYLREFTNTIPFDKMKDYSKTEILIIASGCQGETLAATNKIANGTHPKIRFEKGDTAIFSSKMIPGNEKNILEVYNAFADRDVEVITEKDHFVHVSGHANRNDITEMYKLAKPKIAIPVHGESAHIRDHFELVKKLGVEQSIKAKNGIVIKISEKQGETAIVGEVPSKYMALDGNRIIPADSDVIKKRKKMMYSGMAIVDITIDEDGKLLTKPRILTPGAYDLDKDVDTFEILQEDIIDAVKKIASVSKRSIFAKKKNKNISKDLLAEKITESVKKIINNLFKHDIGKKPVVEVILNIV